MALCENKKSIAAATMPDAPNSLSASDPDGTAVPVARKRPKPGERRIQILQALAEMLEQPDADRITTAALAARLGVSEAALYRHFASKAQMFEGLIEFIEHSVFTLVNQVAERAQTEASDDTAAATAIPRHAGTMLSMVLQFAEKNPGMTRVMVGDALVFENARLQQRMNQFFDKLEATLRQSLRPVVEGSGSDTPSVDAQVMASALTAFLVGRLHRFARSGFKRLPSEHLDASLALIL